MCGGNSGSFCHSASTLCVCVLFTVCHVESIMSKAKEKCKHRGESKQQFRLCVPPCPCYIMSGDSHNLCVVCLGAKHAVSALEGADCPHCEQLSLRTLRSWKALFVVGFVDGSGGGNGDGRVPFFFLCYQIQHPLPGIGSTLSGFFPPGRGVDASFITLFGGRC